MVIKFISDTNNHLTVFQDLTRLCTLRISKNLKIL